MTAPGRNEAALALVLQHRPPTVQDATTLLELPADAALDTLQTLVDDGHLRLLDDAIAYLNPATRVADRVHERLQEVRGMLADIDDELGILPWRVDEWAVGARDRSGALLLLDDLAELAAVSRARYVGRAHRRVVLSAPSIDLLEDLATARESPPGGSLSSAEQIDVLLPAAEARSPDDRARVRALLPGGVEVRLHPDVTRWFLVTTDTVVLHAENGGFVLVQNATVAGVCRGFFDTQWLRSYPLDPVETDVLMDALATGLTVESAARAIGVSTRTAHRRLADTMARYGVTSLFALGAAWERERERR